MNHELVSDDNEQAKKWQSLASPDISDYDDVAANNAEANRKPAESEPKSPAEVLLDKDLLRKVSADYLHQYERGSNVSAINLLYKEKLDDYVTEQLNGQNAEAFRQSEEFQNYAKITMWIAQNRVKPTKRWTLYPELVTNPVLRDERMREAVLQSYYQGDALETARANMGKYISEYGQAIASVERKIEKRGKLSQTQIDVLSDYIYAGRNYDDCRARKLAEYCFNEIEEGDNLQASVPMIGALANYFAKNYSIDEDVRKKSKIIIADGARGADDMRIGTSTDFGCVLEKNHFLEMSLTSDESLKKSRTNREDDIYRLMMVSFHELTHDHQRSSLARGEDTPSAMAYATNRVLRRDTGCIPVTNTKTGEEMKIGYYRANHDSDEIEIDADEEAWRQCRLFLVKHCKMYGDRLNDADVRARFWKRREQCKNNEQEVRTRRAFTRKKNRDGELVSPTYYDIDNLSQKISGDPAILAQYPIFRKYFENDGTIKLSLLYDTRLAASDDEGFDTRTDNMGVEFGTYLVGERDQTRRMVSFINQEGANLSKNQCERLIFNLYNILHQSVLQLRDLNKAKFDNYDETRTHMDSTPQEIKDALMVDYLRRLYNCTWICERLRTVHPELGEMIDRHEDGYFISYYPEISKSASLDNGKVSAILATYERVQNAPLAKVAAQIRRDYGMPPATA